MKDLSKLIKITTPLDEEKVKDLKVGTMVEISGTIYTGRDAAHKNLTETLNKGEEIPLCLQNQIIYYVGPCPAKPEKAIGSCGPTTSGRMDVYTPTLLKQGLKGMIGKGPRNTEVVKAMMDYKAVYFAAIGGTGALLSNTVKKAEIVAYPELGPEAIYRLEIEDFPCIVAIDYEGGNLYELGRREYRITN